MSGKKTQPKQKKQSGTRPTASRRPPGRGRSATQALSQWPERLVQRKYLEQFDPTAAGQLSVRLEHEGNASYFPLGTDEPGEAAARAAALFRALQREGWGRVLERHPREFTLALFWSTNPLLSTYSTLLTHPGRTTPSGKSAAPALSSTAASPASDRGTPLLRVLLFEADPQVRSTLALWASRLPGCTPAGAHALPDPAILRQASEQADVILFNRSQADLLHEEFSRAADRPSLPCVPYGIYETSDDIFISHTGVSRGYFLRRTHPQHTLDPIRNAWTPGGALPDSSQIWLQLRHYFQALMDESRNREEQPKASALTPREEEILLRLSKGGSDKQIASGLNISSWTVHNHMKNIFRKMAVHTRTQAVLKYLQR